MKRTSLLIAAVTLAALGAAQLPETPPGPDPEAPDSSSSSATGIASAGGPTLKLEPIEEPATNKSAELVERSQEKLVVEGSFEKPTPCHSLDLNSSEINSSWTEVRISAVSSGGICAQVLSTAGYRLTLEPEGESAFRLLHGEEEVGIYTVEGGDSGQEDRGVLSSIASFLGGLFG